MKQIAPLCGFVLLACALMAHTARAQDELKQRASWSAPSHQQVKERIDKWLADKKLDDVQKLKVETLWRADGPAAVEDVLERVAITISIVEDAAQPLIALTRGPRESPVAPSFEYLNDEKIADFVRNNLRLYYGRWLAQHDLYDEAQQQLDGLTHADVVDPASLLFYQGVAYHRLLQKDQCLPVLDQLLENEEAVPRRYRKVAELMVADIKPLKTDSLDEIARMMDDIRRRQRLHRAGTRVRKEEEDVLAKLDKLIEELEEQQKKQQQQSGQNGQGSNSSSRPANDSSAMGGSGEGNVDPKKLRTGDEWGNLSEKDREAVLQELSKDLPAHFREVIEEYLKKLARDDPR